jgi:prepilin-type N-terminal cleavage/methylation domain-containing protein
MSAAKRTSGFTLVELLVVIAILVILAAVSIPAVTTWLPNYKLRGAATDLYSRMQYAKSEAIRTNNQYAVVFDPVNGEYKLVNDPGGDGIFGAGGDDNEIEVIRIFDYGPGIAYGHVLGIKTLEDPAADLDDAVNVSYGGNAVVFDGRGLCNTGSVYLKNNSDRTYAVGTLMSGIVRIKRWRSSGWE